MAPVAHVVVFSELSPRARAQYTRFLLEHNVQFAKRPSDGRYVANVRLKSPPEEATHTTSTAQTALRSRSPPTSARRAPPMRNPVDDTVDSPDERVDSQTDASGGDTEDDLVPAHLHQFGAFIDEVGRRMLRRTSVATYAASETKLLRLINDIYDARADDASSSSPDNHAAGSFATFVYDYLKSRFGLRSLVEQQALELLEGLEAHQSRLDVEHFSLFLNGHFADPTLSFFLRARDAAHDAIAMSSALFQPTSAASARRRRSEMNPTSRRQRRISKSTSTLIWLSKSQIESAALAAFGSKTEDSYLQFGHRVRTFLATRKANRSMTALLEIQEFLSLALETFVAMQQSPSPARSASLSSASGHQAHDEYDAVDVRASPPPSPLPPPPLPRPFGTVGLVAAARPRPQGRDEASETPFPPLLPSDAALNVPRTDLTPPVGGDDVQSRLSSLMARMQQRRSLK